MKKTFYKYKSCEGSENESSSFHFLLDSLEKKYFYLSRPENLNDKDEARMFDNYAASYDDIQKWLRHHPYLLKDLKMIIPPNKDPVYEIKKHCQKTEYRCHMEQSRKNEREHFHIFSLTDSPDNEKMWTDYASNYNGICLGFEADTVLQESENNFTDKDERYFIETTDHGLDVEGAYLHQNGKSYLGLINVSYVRKKSIYIKLFKLHEDSEKNKIKDSFLNKNNYNDQQRNKKDWSYERESRIILTDKHLPRNEKTDLIAHYPDHVLTEILLGHNIEADKKTKILNCLKDNYSNYNKIIIKQA